MNKSLINVKVRKGNINLALKKFKRAVRESGHLLEYKDRQEYLKPSVKKRLQKNKAQRERDKHLKHLRKEGLHQ